MNVPPLGSGRLRQFERKLLVFCQTLIGPEFIFHTALGQYISARRSVEDFHASGFQGWTLKHGFFADMGGFVLDPSDFVPFPLNVNQVHYLLCNGYIDYSAVHLSASDISDRNKFDGMSRLITSAQLFWFVLNTIARAAQGLAITTLEISTIGFAFCSLCTYFCWRHKPQDISEPIRLRPKASMADILVQAGSAAAKPYKYTPMDFAGRRPHWFGVMWAYVVQLPSSIGIHLHPRRRPIDKIWDDEYGELGLWQSLVLMLVQFGFAGIHIAAWNFDFPTSVEAMLWHISTVYVFASMIMTWLIFAYAFEIEPRIIRNWRSGPLLEKVSHSSRLQDGLPPLSAMPTIILGALYILARAYIIVEDVANLRDLPASAFNSVDWSNFIPHFW